ncbi:RING finger domain protein [Thermoascus aurantiacus ATCC 26904]
MAANTDISAADASGLLQTLQGHIEDLRSLLQCGICVRPLYEPYTLACGHTFCYGCLTSWFSSGRSHKTCPDCRAQVKAQPAPAYLVRAIVHLFTSRAELLEKGETTAEHREHQRAEAAKVEADKANTHPRTGGLFQGCFKERPPVGQPIIDVEDNVTRCPVCSWELEDTGCTHCGYNLEAETVTGTETEENSEMTDYTDEIDDGFGDIDDEAWNDFYDGVPFEELPFGLQQFHDTRHRRRNRFQNDTYEWQYPPSASSVTHDDSEEEDDSDDDDDDSMASFIDDDEEESDSGSDNSTVVGDHSYTTQDLDNESESETSSDVSMSQDASDDSEEESSEDEEPIRPPVPSSSRRQQRQTNGQRGSASRSTNHQNNESSRAGNRDQNSRSGNRGRGNSNGPAGSSANNAIPVEDDSDSDDDDDVPIPPSRRARAMRHQGGGNHGGRNNGNRNRGNRNNEGRRR